MEPDISKLIEDQLKTLSPNLRQATDSLPWKSLLQEIGKANALDAEQITSLEQETMFILYAFEPSEDYVANIMREVKVPENTAIAVAESVANKIFEPILKKSEEAKSGPSTHTSTPATSPANLPMVEEGQVAHTVPHIEQPNVSLPDYRYQEGKDPYREPLK